MSYDSKKITELLEIHKKLLEGTKKRLNIDENTHTNQEKKGSEIEHANSSDFHFQNVEFISKNNKKPDDGFHLPLKSNNDEEVQNFPLVERLDLSSCNGSFDKDKQAFIDKLENSENPLSFRSDDEGGGTMLRYGEYSPNNPQLRVTAAPYLGLGEYEQRRQLIFKQRQADYREHILRKNNLIKDKVDDYIDRNTNQNNVARHSKSVQTDIQNINNKLVQYELHSQNPPEKELSPQPAIFQDSKMHSGRANKLESRYTSTQSNTLRAESSKPKSILSSRRTDLHRDVHHSYVPSILDRFSYQDREEYLDKERLKRETYQAELQQQIDEKKRLIALRDAQERRDQELENRRFEQQLLKMEDEQYKDEQYQKQKSNLFRRTSEDFKGYREELYESSLRKQFDSDNSLRNTKVASKQLSHYSPPISRRVPYSFNIPSTSVFSNPSNRYTPPYFDVYNKKDNFMRRNCFSRSESVNRDEPRSRSNSFNRHEHVLNRHESLSRIDSLQRQDSLSRFETLSIRDGVSGGIPRRHSATQQELNLMRSPKPHRYDRGSCSKLDDTLPIPILKAHSPVAKDLKNSIAVDSSKHSSEALRKLEDRWQIPAVQRNIIRHGDPHSDGHGHSTLTQIGAIRMQLQKEQLRMNESFRKRISSQPKAV